MLEVFAPGFHGWLSGQRALGKIPYQTDLDTTLTAHWLGTLGATQGLTPP